MRATAIEQAIQGIAQVLASPELVAATTRLLSQAQRERIGTALDRMRHKTAYVAVLGAQGTGKSSLLNSLLFKRRLLPIGEGATTNIVCRVHDAAGEAERAEISFKSGQTLVEPLEPASLQTYMDETQNPGNTRGVRWIACFANADLLRANTSFVDTPGLGSLFLEQDNETMAFANEISLGLFVLRTTPPLLESEASFLGNVWKLCPEFVFVQNVWNESPEDVEASMRDNIAKLTAIAQKMGDDKEIVLVPVDVHAALEGATNSLPDLVERSGLNRLKVILGKRIQRDGQALEVVSRGRQIVLCLRLGIQSAQAEIGTLNSNASAHRKLEMIEALEQEVRAVGTRSRDREVEYRQRVKDHIASFQRTVSNGIESVLMYVNAEVRSGRDGVEEVFLDQLRQKVIDAADMFQNGFALTSDAYIAAAVGDLLQLDRALAVELHDLNASIEDVSGTYVAEGAAKVAVTVGGIVLTALTGASAMTFATVVGAGGGAMAGLAAGFATIPGVGWAIAAGIVGVGLVVRGIARGKRRNALIQTFAAEASRIKAEVTKRLSQAAGQVSERVISEVRRETQAAITQKESVVAKMRAGVAATEEDKKESERLILSMVADLEAGIAEVERLIDVAQKA